MGLDRSEEEPAEYDPEAELSDPDADGFTIPSVDVPPAHDPEAEFADPETDSLTIPSVDADPGDAPDELVRHFWTIVAVLNAANLLFAVGLMIAYFWGDLRRGGLLVAGGLVLYGLTYRRYRSIDFDAIDGADDEVDGPSEGVR